MLVTKALALTAIKVIMDDGLFDEVSALSNHCQSEIILTCFDVGQEGLQQAGIDTFPAPYSDRSDNL